MLADLASACIGIVVALLIAFPAAGMLRKYPVPFYAVAVLLVAAHFVYRMQEAYFAPAQMFLDVLNKGYLGCALLAIVMFTGVLDMESPLRHRLQPIRAELSILSFIFICDHVIGYAPAFFPVLGQLFTVRAGMAVSFVAAIVLTAVFVVLTVTSVKAIRAKMSRTTWKNIQRGSYAMVGLLWLHIVLVLARPAFSETGGSQSAQFALAVYTIVVAVYAVLRVRKALRDRRKRGQEEHPSVADAA